LRLGFEIEIWQKLLDPLRAAPAPDEFGKPLEQKFDSLHPKSFTLEEEILYASQITAQVLCFLNNSSQIPERVIHWELLFDMRGPVQ
jgi:hypothetical protein